MREKFVYFHYSSMFMHSILLLHNHDQHFFTLQVLARFEGFPEKKLEAIRTAAALGSKLNGMIIELQNWKIEAPLGQLLDRTERYFNKVNFHC